MSSFLRVVGFFFFYSEVVFLYTVASILFFSADNFILELGVLNKVCLQMFTEKSGYGNGNNKKNKLLLFDMWFCSCFFHRFTQQSLINIFFSSH